jgi:hypothetical protein
MNKKLKEFILVYECGGKDITNHYDINEVKNLYLNKQIRSSRGTIEVCIKVIEK